MEQLITRRNKRRTVQQQIAAIYEESRRLGVENPPTLEHHLEEVGRSVTEANRLAEQRRLQALRQSKTTEKEQSMKRDAFEKPKDWKPKQSWVSDGMAESKDKKPRRDEQVFAIIQSNGGATLKVIAERMSVSRDAAWGAARLLIVAGRIKGMRSHEHDREQTYVAVDA